MKPLWLSTTMAVVGLSACHVVFHEGGQDAASDNDAVVDAVVVDTPTAPVNIIFVTGLAFTGNLGGRAGADQKCRDAANAAGLGGTFVAVLGDSGAGIDPLATSRISMARGWGRPDGKPVVDKAADLVTGKQWYPITLDQAGTDLGSTATYWSGSMASGATGTDCNRWSSDTMGSTGDIGHGQRAAGLGMGPQTCDRSAHLLCAGSDLQATITPPHGTNKRIFVSTATFVPNMAGRQQADDICAAEAAGVGLPRTFLAFLGTS
nr:hypothetical protein [Kofleriaceae bacterium]